MPRTSQTASPRTRDESLPPPTLAWSGGPGGCLRLIDQTRLPERLTWVRCRDEATLRRAIATLQVRGAPAIGIAGAFGLVLATRRLRARSPRQVARALSSATERIGATRPTAVNLQWALDRLYARAAGAGFPPNPELTRMLLDEARAIRDEDEAACRAIGRHGFGQIRRGKNFLTHCNAGSLATARYGTALAPFYRAHELGRKIHVYADETRPLLQGSRLTAWELSRAGIPVTVLCDGAAGSLLASGRIDAVLVGADRIAANGDVANKVGTYPLAVLAHRHNVPFYVAAPSSTIDPGTPNGAAIPIEFRSGEEVARGFGRRTAPRKVDFYAPAFDVTPEHLITGVITENGLQRFPIDEDE